MLVGNKFQTNLLQQKRPSRLLQLEKKEQAPSSKPPVTETATKSTEVRKKNVNLLSEVMAMTSLLSEVMESHFNKCGENLKPIFFKSGRRATFPNEGKTKSLRKKTGKRGKLRKSKE